MFDLDQAIQERHSTRMFLPRPVPRDLVNEALALAQWAPSNSNISRGDWCLSAGPPALALRTDTESKAQRPRPSAGKAWIRPLSRVAPERL
jgi:nitroreductase